MKTIILFIIFLSNLAWSKDEPSNDFSRSSNEIKQVTPDELSWRLHITGEIYVLNAEGDKLVNVANEKRDWRFGGGLEKPLESNWLFQQKGLPTVALRQKWYVGKDGRISVEIYQYDNIERGEGAEIKFGKLLKEDKIVLKDFAPINWPIAAGQQKLVVRLTPGVWQNDDAIDVSSLPVSGKNVVIFDSAGKVWADQVAADRPSVFFGVTTHVGSLFLSFSQFKGAKLIGDAKGGRIKIKDGKDSIILQSETPFVPKDIKANVYGIIKPEIQTGRLKSVRTYSSSKEEEFLKAFVSK